MERGEDPPRLDSDARPSYGARDGKRRSQERNGRDREAEERGRERHGKERGRERDGEERGRDRMREAPDPKEPERQEKLRRSNKHKSASSLGDKFAPQKELSEGEEATESKRSRRER